MKKLFVFTVVIFVVSSVFATTIYDIQYTTEAGPDGTYPSPMVDEEVTVTGIVTGENYNQDNKFFLTDPGGGPWHGVYVYDYETGPMVGDEVEVTGTVTEYYGLTELGYCTINILSQGNDVPDPIEVTTLDLVVPALAEQYEGCLVQVDGVTVTETQNDYGEWYIDDGSGECQVDDGFFYLDEVVPPIVIEVDMFWGRIIGCVDYSYDEFAINPRTPDDLIEEVFTQPTTVEAIPVLNDNYPNPFNPETTIQFNLVENSNVSLTVYNVKGEVVNTLVDEAMPVGNHSVVWNGTDANNFVVPSGIYFYKMKAGDRYTSTKKMILLK